MGLAKEIWDRLKKLGVSRRYVKDTSGEHPGAIRGDKVQSKRATMAQGKRRQWFTGHQPTQHERVVAGRARRQGMSVHEYKRIYGG